MGAFIVVIDESSAVIGSLRLDLVVVDAIAVDNQEDELDLVEISLTAAGSVPRGILL